MKQIPQQKHVMIIAGEASGDLHGSHLVRAMLRENDDLSFIGIGGHAMKKAGVKILMNASELTVVGITEVFSKILNIFRGLSIAKKQLKSLRPDLLILIDFPDFNLRVAPMAKKLGIPVLYYISPQVWAWRSGRVKKIKKVVDHMVVILPFEEDFYTQEGIPVTFVGHPLLDNPSSLANNDPQKIFGGDPVIGLLRGSRDGEIRRHLPVILDAMKRLMQRMKNIRFIISLASSMERAYMERMISKHLQGADFELVSGGVDKVFSRCHLLLSASGTVTLEAAIHGVPMIIIYKMSSLSYRVVKALIQVKRIGLVNLIANDDLVPELVQNDANPEKIADTAFHLLDDRVGLEALREKLLGIREKLGGPGASERASKIAAGML